MSSRYDLRALGPVPCDINPHRYYTPEETQALIDACREDDRRGDADVRAYMARRCQECHRASGNGCSRLDCPMQFDDFARECGDDPVLLADDETDLVDAHRESGCALRWFLYGWGAAATVLLIAAVMVLGPMLPAGGGK